MYFVSTIGDNQHQLSANINASKQANYSEILR